MLAMQRAFIIGHAGAAIGCVWMQLVRKNVSHRGCARLRASSYSETPVAAMASSHAATHAPPRTVTQSPSAWQRMCFMRVRVIRAVAAPSSPSQSTGPAAGPADADEGAAAASTGADDDGDAEAV